MRILKNSLKFAGILIALLIFALYTFAYVIHYREDSISEYPVYIGALLFISCLCVLFWNLIWYKKLSRNSTYGLLISLIVFISGMYFASKEIVGLGPQTKLIIGEALSPGGPTATEITLSPDGTYEKSFLIKGKDIVVYGIWSGGGSVLVLDDGEYKKWSLSQPFDALYYSNGGSWEHMLVPIGASGNYHVVISNVGSEETKTWVGEIDVICRKLSSFAIS
jgi:hypothetical protein